MNIKLTDNIKILWAFDTDDEPNCYNVSICTTSEEVEAFYRTYDKTFGGREYYEAIDIAESLRTQGFTEVDFDKDAVMALADYNGNLKKVCVFSGIALGGKIPFSKIKKEFIKPVFSGVYDGNEECEMPEDEELDDMGLNQEEFSGSYICASMDNGSSAYYLCRLLLRDKPLAEDLEDNEEKTVATQSIPKSVQIIYL